jgi:hypothetical protein
MIYSPNKLCVIGAVKVASGDRLLACQDALLSQQVANMIYDGGKVGQT